MSGVVVQKAFSLFVSSPLVGSIRQPSFEQLALEIAADVGISTLLIDPGIRPYNMGVPDVGLQFASALSAPEITALDVLIGLHTGVDPVRPTNSDTHTFSGPPTVTDDGTVLGVDGLPKYRVGDFGYDSTTGPDFIWYFLGDATTGAAVWVPRGPSDIRSDVALTITTPHLIEANTASIFTPRVARNVEEIVVLSGADTGASGGSFTFELFHGVNLSSLVTIGTVTITQGTQRGTTVISPSHLIPANHIFVVNTLAIGSFPIGTAIRRKRFYFHIRMSTP